MLTLCDWHLVWFLSWRFTCVATVLQISISICANSWVRDRRCELHVLIHSPLYMCAEYDCLAHRRLFKIISPLSTRCSTILSSPLPTAFHPLLRWSLVLLASDSFLLVTVCFLRTTHNVPCILRLISMPLLIPLPQHHHSIWRSFKMLRIQAWQFVQLIIYRNRHSLHFEFHIKGDMMHLSSFAWVRLIAVVFPNGSNCIVYSRFVLVGVSLTIFLYLFMAPRVVSIYSNGFERFPVWFGGLFDLL